MVYSELDTAIASIDNLSEIHTKEFNEVVGVMDIVHRNSTIGLTLEDGKTLRKLGVEVELEKLGTNRVHLGNEAMLTDTGKTGLYGLAIGALVVIVGFIIKKIWGWFKGTSSSGSGTKSNSEIAKTVPSMASNPTMDVKIPYILLDKSTVDAFQKDAREYLDSFMTLLTDMMDAFGEAGAGGAGETKRATIASEAMSEFLKGTKSLGYSLKASTAAEMRAEIKGYPLEDTKYGKLDEVEVEVNSEKYKLSSSLKSDFDAFLKDLEKLKGEESTDTDSLKRVKDISGCIHTVLSHNFIKGMKLIVLHNRFLDDLTAKYTMAFDQSRIEKLRSDPEAAAYFKSVASLDKAGWPELKKVYSKMKSDGKFKTDPSMIHFSKIDEIINAYQTTVAKIVSGESKSDDKK